MSGARERLLERVRADTGLTFPADRSEWADDAFASLADDRGLRSIEALEVATTTDPELFDALLDRLTVGETYFFRHREQLEWSVDHVIVPRLESAPSVAVWCAACSTGPEPYSLAIAAERRGIADRVHIMGTDLSPGAIAAARAGRYSRWALRGVSPDERSRWFVSHPPNEWAIDPRIRARVRFARHNLLDPHPAPPGGGDGFDLVLCRNVLIYFDDDSIRVAARRLHDAMKDGGWLVTAASDRALSSYAPLHAVSHPHGLSYQRDDHRPWSPGAVLAPVGDETEARDDSHPSTGRLSSLAPWPSAWDTGLSDRAVSVARISSTPAGADQAPTGLEARSRAAHAALSVGDVTRALELTEGADSPDLAAIHVQALGVAEAPAAALEAALPIVTAHAVSGDVQLVYALLQMSAGRAAEAVATLRRCLYLDRANAFAHFVLGTANLALGDERAARRSFRNALDQLRAVDQDAPIPWADGATGKALADAARAHLARIDRSPGGTP